MREKTRYSGIGLSVAGDRHYAPKEQHTIELVTLSCPRNILYLAKGLSREGRGAELRFHADRWIGVQSQ